MWVDIRNVENMFGFQRDKKKTDMESKVKVNIGMLQLLEKISSNVNNFH